jgi:hypothetical protein
MSCTLRPSPRLSSAPHLVPALCLGVIGLFSALTLCAPARAAAINESIPDAQGLVQLEERASSAKPREQCILYTQLVHTMTEKAGKELYDGETEKAATTLSEVNRVTHLIEANIAKDAKGLKDAEILMQHTTHRMGQFLHLVNGDDKEKVQATLKRLDQVNDHLLTQVFAQ